MRKNANKLVLNLLGLLLLTAAAMKGWQLLTEPVANKDIFSSRPFLIFTVEFELALGIWLISGLFRKTAWLSALLCFGLFSVITFYKAITGADSCGCFGSVKINPWITLFAIDIPAIITLMVFRPALSFLRKPESIAAFVRNVFAPLPSIPRFTAIFSIGVIILAVTGCVLAFNEPAKVTSGYEVLEPETWVGKKLPILEDIDIGKQLTKGTWLLLLYHHDCPDCIKAIAMYEQISRDLTGNEDFLKVAFIEVPPYGASIINKNYILGRLDNSKEWFITTPAAILLGSSKVKSAWEVEVPGLKIILKNLTNIANKISKLNCKTPNLNI